MIGIYGGTFNPVHYGHLRTGLEAKDAFRLEQLRWIPCQLPAHREQPEVGGEMRLAMLELAIADVEGFVADRRELDRAGRSYMVDTLQSLRAEFPDTPLLLFIGGDAFLGLENWYQWQRLFDYAHVVVMTRPGFQPLVVSEFFANRLQTNRTALTQQPAGCLFFQTVTALDISATAIRKLCVFGDNPKFLLPDAVIRFIQQHQLYQALPEGN